MAEIVDHKNLVTHIANGKIGNICLICLTPLLNTSFESVFTLVCKEDTEYCVADALAAVCQVKLHLENFNVCTACFKSASEAYKFHLQATRSMELVNHYTQELLNNVKNVQITDDDVEKLLCIPLAEYKPMTKLFNLNFDSVGSLNSTHQDDDYIKFDSTNREDDNILLVVKKDKESDDENSDNLPNSMLNSDDDMVVIVNEKVRKKRDPMVYMTCSRCPVKYRFVAKLRDHMKTVHDIDLYYCKICKIVSEHKLEYEEHLKEHIGNHQCTVCNAVYKKPETLVAHMKLHEKGNHEHQLENANVCEQCGAILEDESSLETHMTRAHVKRYTCYYCGRMYRVEASFEAHLKKHEDYWRKKERSKSEKAIKEADPVDKSNRSVCQTCGKDFVDERSLLWHQRLHSNDRPYTCEECGRGFVTVNRRNQHALCAHTPPQRRCPLCPALFHLRSMVNTHLKKVHLKSHKRRNRSSKHQNVFWRTQTVPIQELSIDLQNDVMELQAAQEGMSVSKPMDSQMNY